MQPGWRTFVDEGVDAFVGVTKLQVLHHHLLAFPENNRNISAIKSAFRGELIDPPPPNE